MLSIAISAQQLEADLAAGELACPVCSGPLSRWGSRARARSARAMECGRCGHGERCAPSATPRTCCARRGSLPRRRDSAEVIGEALRLALDGDGHRRIASKLDRPPGTVRGWLRAARRRAGELRACATRQLVALDVQVGAVTPAGSELGDAVEAMMLAVRAFRLRFGAVDQAGVWERAVWLTGGLLHGRPPPPRSAPPAASGISPTREWVASLAGPAPV